MTCTEYQEDRIYSVDQGCDGIKNGKYSFTISFKTRLSPMNLAFYKNTVKIILSRKGKFEQAKKKIG